MLDFLSRHVDDEHTASIERCLELLAEELVRLGAMTF